MGPGSINAAADEIKRQKAGKVMIITDPGLVAAGIVERLDSLLSEGGLELARFDKVEPDPRYEIAVKRPGPPRRPGPTFWWA